LSQHKKQQTKDRRTSKRKRTATTYTLELLESRVLLSADLAGAVQVIPINPAQTPSQAVTLNVPSGPAAAQQTFSVAEMLAKLASSFPQSAGESSQAIANAANHAPGLPRESETQIIFDQQGDVTSQPVTPTVQTQPSTSQNTTSATTGNTSLLQTQSQPTLSTDTAIHTDTISPIVQSQPTPTASSGVISEGTSLPLLDPVSQVQDLPIAQPIATTASTVISAPVTDTQTLQTSQDQTISQSLVVPVQTVSPSLVSDVQTDTTSQALIQPTPPTTEISQELTQLVSQPIATITSSDATNPQLPQAYVDTSMPSTAVTVRVGPHGDYTDLQTALNSVSLGTTILLEPGVSYTSTNDVGFILPNKTTGTGWIVIRPDVPDSALPAPGTRVTPADSAVMPKILRGDLNLYAMSVAPGAHNYRIIGVEFMNKGNVNTPYNGAFVNLDGREESVATQSNHIVLDRVYIHGPSAPGALGVKFGVVLGGQYQAVIDSDIEELVSPDGESKAIAMWNGAGPIKIQNNLLSAAGENIMIGGADPVISGLVPSDIEIRDNNFFKPLKWQDPAYASPATGYAVGTKNLFELKNAQRVLVDGNVFENVWYPNNQSAFAILITPRNQDGTAPWSVVQDVTFTDNTIIGAANGIAVSGFDQNSPSQHGGRMLFQNNLITNLGTVPSIDINGGTGKFFLISNGVSDLHIINNTVANYVGTIGNDFTFSYGIADEGDLFPLQGLIIQGNVLQHPGNITFHASAPLATVAPGAILG
jgi:hypothetical protein